MTNPASILLALAMATAALTAQSNAPGGEDDAEALLRAAREEQFAGGGAPPITSLEARLAFVVFEPDGGGKLKKASGDTEQIVSVRGGRYALESRTTREGKGVVDHIIDYDDKCWQIMDGIRTRLRKTSKTRQDVENLRERKRRMTRLFRLFFLGSLEVKPGSPAVVERGVDVAFKLDVREFRFHADHIRFEDRDGNTIDAWIDRKTHDVVRARVSREGEAVDDFYMARFATVTVGTDGKTGVKVPHGMCVYENGKAKLVLTGELGDIRFNTLDERRRAALFGSKKKKSE